LKAEKTSNKGSIPILQQQISHPPGTWLVSMLIMQ